MIKLIGFLEHFLWHWSHKKVLLLIVIGDICLPGLSCGAIGRVGFAKDNINT
jgi:hypothetical protein